LITPDCLLGIQVYNVDTKIVILHYLKIKRRINYTGIQTLRALFRQIDTDKPEGLKSLTEVASMCKSCKSKESQ
jgi:hypothetical protein